MEIEKTLPTTKKQKLSASLWHLLWYPVPVSVNDHRPGPLVCLKKQGHFSPLSESPDLIITNWWLILENPPKHVIWYIGWTGWMTIQQNSITFCDQKVHHWIIMSNPCLSEFVPPHVYHMVITRTFWSIIHPHHFLCVEVYPMDYYSNKGGPWANYGTHSGHGGRWVVRKRMVKT